MSSLTGAGFVSVGLTVLLWGSWKSDANIHNIPRISAVKFFTKLLILLNIRRSVLLDLGHFNTITTLKQVCINLIPMTNYLFSLAFSFLMHEYVFVTCPYDLCFR